MLTNIENRLEELFEMIEMMPQDKVEAAEKVLSGSLFGGGGGGGGERCGCRMCECGEDGRLWSVIFSVIVHKEQQRHIIPVLSVYLVLYSFG